MPRPKRRKRLQRPEGHGLVEVSLELTPQEEEQLRALAAQRFPLGLNGRPYLGKVATACYRAGLKKIQEGEERGGGLHGISDSEAHSSGLRLVSEIYDERDGIGF